MNNGVIAKQYRVDVDVKMGADGKPTLVMKFPREFYEWPTQRQGEAFVQAAGIAFESFWQHVAAIRKAGG